MLLSTKPTEIMGMTDKNLELFSLLAHVANVKSLVIPPQEHIDDILEDLEEAFKAVE